MAGAIGATGGKFVLMGAALLLHGRVDDNAVRIAIVPGAPTSAVSTALAERIKPGNSDVKIHLRAESFDAKIAAVEPQVGPDADLRIGQDVLSGHPIEIDFVHHQVQPLSPGEAARLEARSQPIAIRHEANGTLSVDVSAGHRPPVSAKLDLSSDLGFASPDGESHAQIKVGGVDLPQVSVTTGARPVIGLYAFKHTRVIFDFAHDRIWVRS